MYKIKIVRFICCFFPPILSQKVRDLLISTKDATKNNYSFKRKSFTGSLFYGNIKDFHAFKFYIHGFFDWRNIVLTKTILNLKKGSIIEVGANIGTETISLADICKDKVYAFEPYLPNYQEIEYLKLKNNLDNLIISSKAISNYIGETDFVTPSENSSGSGSIVANNNTLQNKSLVKVKVSTLDSELNKNEDFSVILIDVEGNELNVLKGAIEIIKKSKPFIILEVNKRLLNSNNNNEFHELINFVKINNYELFYIKKIGLERVNVEKFKKYSNKNCICIPNNFLNKKNLLKYAIFKFSFNPVV